MYGRATFAIDVSSSSMKVASVTVTAMNHGLTEDRLMDGFPFDTAALSTHVDCGLDRHSRPQQVLFVLILIEPDSHGESLHYLDVVSGSVLGREQAEQRTGGAGKALNLSLVVTSESVDPDRYGFTRAHMSELRFFEVCGDPDVVQRDNREQTLARLNTMAEFDRFPSDHAAHRRIDFRVAKVQLRGVQIGACLLQMAAGRIRFSAGVGNLLRSDTGFVDLRLALNDEAARFGDLLLSRSEVRAIGFHSLISRAGFCFAGVVIGPRNLPLFDQCLVANAIPFGAGKNGLVLL